jgi:hypothetical protein
MDISKRTREDEKGITLTDWLEALDVLGIDTKKSLKEEHELLARRNTLGHHYQQYKAAQEAGPVISARKLAGSSADYEQFALELSTAAIASEPAVKDRAAKIMDLAAGIATSNAYNHFRRRGEGLYNIIAPTFEQIRGGIIEAGSLLPDGVGDLETAARAGVEQQWLRLEALVEQWDGLLELIEAWYIDGVLDTGDRELSKYTASMFVFTDYEKAINTYGIGILRTVRQVLTCKPNLLTIDQVDELESTKVTTATPDETRAAHYRQHKADEEARALLQAEWNENGISARQGKAALKQRA